MPNYTIRGNELWVEVDANMLQQLIGDPKIRVVLQGKLYFVIRLERPIANIPGVPGGVPA